MSHKLSLVPIIATIVLVCGGCSSNGDLLTAAPSDVEQDTTYLIGPGDGLEIFVWRNEDLSTNIQVRPDGKISIPLINDLEAVGKTPTELASDIESLLSEYVRTPTVTVIVTSFGVGAYGNQIRVLGAGAAQPQNIPFRQGLTLLDVMIEVGLTEFAAGDRSKLVRRRNGEFVEIGVRLNRLVNRGDIAENLPVLPGDVLIIPETRF